jgi:hypothetical protein
VVSTPVREDGLRADRLVRPGDRLVQPSAEGQQQRLLACEAQPAASAAAQAEEALDAGELERARAQARDAAMLTRLPLLAGEEGAWLERKRRELAGVRAGALECLTEACLRSGQFAEAAKWSEQAVALEPYRESGYRRLMREHVAAGDGAQALRVYEKCRRLLADELGAYPSSGTEALFGELLQAAPSKTTATAQSPDGAALAVEETSTPDVPRQIAHAEALGAPHPTPGAESRRDPGLEPVRRRTISRRRRAAPGRLVIAIGSLAVAAAVVVAMIGLAGGGGGGGRAAQGLLEPGSVARVDPVTGRVLATIGVPAGPRGSPSAAARCGWLRTARAR